MAESESELQNIVDTVRSNSERCGLKMNVKKTKTMVISRYVLAEMKINVDGVQLKQVIRFKYLGQIITDDGRCDAEVKTRIEIARAEFVGMKDVLTSRQLNIKLRLRLIRCFISSTLLYSSETWTLNQDLCRRHEAFEMWMYRRMFKISYHIT